MKIVIQGKNQVNKPKECHIWATEKGKVAFEWQDKNKVSFCELNIKELMEVLKIFKK